MLSGEMAKIIHQRKPIDSWRSLNYLTDPLAAD